MNGFLRILQWTDEYSLHEISDSHCPCSIQNVSPFLVHGSTDGGVKCDAEFITGGFIYGLIALSSASAGLSTLSSVYLGLLAVPRPGPGPGPAKVKSQTKTRSPGQTEMKYQKA